MNELTRGLQQSDPSGSAVPSSAAVLQTQGACNRGAWATRIVVAELGTEPMLGHPSVVFDEAHVSQDPPPGEGACPLPAGTIGRDTFAGKTAGEDTNMSGSQLMAVGIVGDLDGTATLLGLRDNTGIVDTVRLPPQQDEQETERRAKVDTGEPQMVSLAPAIGAIELLRAAMLPAFVCKMRRAKESAPDCNDGFAIRTGDLHELA